MSARRPVALLLVALLLASVPGPSLAAEPSPVPGPQIELLLASGAARVSERVIPFTLTLAPGASAESMRVSPDGGETWGEWLPFATDGSVHLSSTRPVGPVRVALETRDASGRIRRIESELEYRPADRASMEIEADYRIEASLDASLARIRARTRIELTNRDSAPLTLVRLYLAARATRELDGTVELVDESGAPVAFRWANNATMAVVLPYPLDPGQRFVLLARNAVRAGSRIATSIDARLSRANGITFAARFFPVLSDGSALRWPGDAYISPSADYRVTIEHPAGVLIAAPGERQPGATPTRETYLLPHARDFAFAASAGYVMRSTKSADGVRIEAYTRSGARSATTARLAARALEAFGARLDRRLPWERLVLFESPRRSHGTEFSGILAIGGGALGSRSIVTHEVGHEWFYALVGANQFTDPWIDEAITAFLTSEILGTGRPGYCSNRPLDSPVSAWPDDPSIASSGACGSYFQTTYQQGEAMLWGLRDRMGAGALREALREMVRRYAFRIITTAEVRAILIEHGASEGYLGRFLRR